MNAPAPGPQPPPPQGALICIGEHIVLSRADPHTAPALAAYAYSCRCSDPQLAAELAAAAWPATRSPAYWPDGVFDLTSPIVAMAAAIAERHTGHAEWTGAELDGQREHFIALAWAGFHALTGAGAAVLAIPENGGPAVVYHHPPHQHEGLS